jgi:kynureninase
MKTLDDCQQLDAKDPLRALRDQFNLPEGVIYLDGNSLGALPKTAAARVAQAVTQEWGQGLIRSWNSAGWVEQPRRLGDKIARLIGAAPGEVVVADSTSINLYKVLSAALAIAAHDSPERKVVLSERSNFPTDLYIAEGLCKERGFTLKLVASDAMEAALNNDVAVLMLTHVNYRTGTLFDMATVTRIAHQAGVLTVWDLAHSAGAVPVDLNGAQADFAIGCGYKFLNGGPGAPAFVWVNTRHTNRADFEVRQPLTGWFGHAAPFAFTPRYTPASGINRYLCGTPPVLGLAALDCGLDTLLSALPLGGMAALYAKSMALTDLFITLVELRCSGHGLAMVTPKTPGRRGSQVSLTCESGDAFAIMQALIARGVIGDVRAGDASNGNATNGHSQEASAHNDILRFGFTPLYTGFADVWQAVDHLKQVLDTKEWMQPQFNQKLAVT